MNTTCPDCGSEMLVDGDFIGCEECGFGRELTDDELSEMSEYDAELAADRILEQQELEDFEGIGFEGECYDFEGCCDE
jgi:hypothetical protein